MRKYLSKEKFPLKLPRMHIFDDKISSGTRRFETYLLTYLISNEAIEAFIFVINLIKIKIFSEITYN